MLLYFACVFFCDLLHIRLALAPTRCFGNNLLLLNRIPGLIYTFSTSIGINGFEAWRFNHWELGIAKRANDLGGIWWRYDCLSTRTT